MNAPSAPEFWLALQGQGLVDGDMPAAAAPGAPWYVRAMMGVGGWIAALFLFAFLLLVILEGMHVRDEQVMLPIGVLAMGAAFAMFYMAPRNDFAAQFGLALAVAGQVLACIGMHKSFGSGETPAFYFAAAALEAGVTLVLPNFVARLLSSWAAMGLLTIALDGIGLGAWGAAIAAAGFAAVTLPEKRLAAHGALARPVSAGLLLALLYLGANFTFHLAPNVWYRYGRDAVTEEYFLWLLRAGAPGAVLAASVLALLHREHVRLSSGAGAAALGGALLMVLVAARDPAAGYAMLILLAGFATGRRTYMGLGILALLVFVSHYYYAMEYTLLEKSMLLAVSGMLLLSARLAMHRLLPVEEAHA